MREIRALTSLRGVAALVVVMQHFSATAQLHSAVSIPSLVPHGYIAVDLFFALSGFIMSYTYAETFAARGWRAYADFLGRRVARVVPLNVAVLLAIVAAGGISVVLLGRNIFFEATNLPIDLLANLLLLQGFGIGTNLNGPSWSISTEFAAYLAFPVLIVFAFRARVAAAALAVVAVAAVAVLAAQHPRLGLDTETPGAAVVRCFAEFSLGMVAWRLYRLPGVARAMAADRVSVLLAGACAVSMVARVDLPAVLLFPVLIVALACNAGRVAAALGWAPLHWLGLVSFSLYLIHQPFRPLELLLLQSAHPALLSGPAALLFALVGSLSVLPFAALTYATVERPGRSAVKWLLASRRPPAAGVASR